MKNYSYVHKNEPAVMIITVDNEKDANSILDDIVKLPHLWRLEEIGDVKTGM